MSSRFRQIAAAIPWNKIEATNVLNRLRRSTITVPLGDGGILLVVGNEMNLDCAISWRQEL
jgi:hypothetical protein